MLNQWSGDAEYTQPRAYFFAQFCEVGCPFVRLLLLCAKFIPGWVQKREDGGGGGRDDDGWVEGGREGERATPNTSECTNGVRTFALLAAVCRIPSAVLCYLGFWVANEVSDQPQMCDYAQRFDMSAHSTYLQVAHD